MFPLPPSGVGALPLTRRLAPAYAPHRARARRQHHHLLQSTDNRSRARQARPSWRRPPNGLDWDRARDLRRAAHFRPNAARVASCCGCSAPRWRVLARHNLEHGENRSLCNGATIRRVSRQQQRARVRCIWPARPFVGGRLARVLGRGPIIVIICCAGARFGRELRSLGARTAIGEHPARCNIVAQLATGNSQLATLPLSAVARGVPRPAGRSHSFIHLRPCAPLPIGPRHRRPARKPSSFPPRRH